MLKTLFRAAALVFMALSVLLTSPTIAKESGNLAAFEQKVASSNAEIPKEGNAAVVVKIKAKSDNRAKRLKKFLSAQGSPMQNDAQNLVDIADKYGLDYRFLPAVAGVESTYGRFVPAGSYNPYGWNNGSFYFSSWKAASEYVAKQITVRWGYLGKITPTKIGPSYAANPYWASRVLYNMSLIGNF